MMKYNISYEKRCLKYLKRLDKNTQLRILKAINNLQKIITSITITQSKLQSSKISSAKMLTIFLHLCVRLAIECLIK